MRCSKCRTELSSTSAFCTNCGLKLSTRVAPPPKLIRPWPITLLAILHFLIALALGLATIAGAVVVFGGEGEDFPLVVVVAAMTAVQFATGLGLWRLRRYGRVLQIVLSCFGLLLIPLGTIVSILILFYMLQPRNGILFSEKSPSELSAREAEILAAPASAAVVVAAVVLGLFGFMATMLIAAIAIPNFLHALDSARGMRTVADMQTIGALVEQYAADHGRFPDADDIEELRPFLVPQYAARIPLVDGWERPWIVQSHAFEYRIWSTGKDGRLEDNIAGGATDRFDADIVMSNGKFLQWPERAQRLIDDLS